MEFYLPVRLITGPGAVRDNADRIAAFGSRCLLVTGGSSARRCGALADVTAALDSRGVAWEVFDGIRQNPTIESCVEGGRAAHAFGADFILGIGGGSPLDAAKVVAVSAANPELDPAGLYRLNWPRAPLPVVLVGTTAGTGSEVTPVAVITDTDGRKRSFRGETMYAALALGDSRYTHTLPPAVTASTGVDALAHCLESCLSKTATDFSRAAACEGIRLLLPPLGTVAAGGTPTEEEREALYQGSLLAGAAISVTGTVLPHNLGYYLTETHGVPHGFACAVFLPALLRHAAAAAPETLRTLTERTGTDPEALIALIRALTPDPGIRLTPEALDRLLPRWENSGALRKTVGEVSLAQVRRIFEDLFVDP